MKTLTCCADTTLPRSLRVFLKKFCFLPDQNMLPSELVSTSETGPVHWQTETLLSDLLVWQGTTNFEHHRLCKLYATEVAGSLPMEIEEFAGLNLRSLESNPPNPCSIFKLAFSATMDKQVRKCGLFSPKCFYTDETSLCFTEQAAMCVFFLVVISKRKLCFEPMNGQWNHSHANNQPINIRT